MWQPGELCGGEGVVNTIQESLSPCGVTWGIHTTYTLESTLAI